MSPKISEFVATWSPAFDHVLSQLITRIILHCPVKEGCANYLFFGGKHGQKWKVRGIVYIFDMFLLSKGPAVLLVCNICFFVVEGLFIFYR